MSADAPHQYRVNETIEDAIHDDIKAIGGAKAAASIFFPEKDQDTAAGIVRAWSNVNRSERPNPGQIILLKKKAFEAVGISEIVRYEERVLSQKVTWLDPKDELQELLRANQECFATIARHQARIDRAVERLASQPGKRTK